jgi:glycosyltransferase involved in cell wall biosynthesis
VLIIDGFSEDNTISIAQYYMANSNKIRYISEKDHGIYDAVNKGIDLCRGKWVYIMGSDDRFHDPKVLSAIFNTVIRDVFHIIYGNVCWMHPNPIIYDDKFDLEKLTHRNICQQAIFYKRILFQMIGNFNLRYPTEADWEFNIRAFCRGKALFVDRIISCFAAGGISSKLIPPLVSQEMREIIHRHFSKKQLVELMCRRFMNKITNWIRWHKKRICHQV